MAPQKHVAFFADNQLSSVDVEEHFQVAAFDNIILPSEWSKHNSIVAQNTRLILNLLDKYETEGDTKKLHSETDMISRATEVDKE